MKIHVYRVQSKGGYKCRFSNLPFENGIVKKGACYFSTYCSENPEHDELTKFLISYFNLPFEKSIEIEL